MIYRTEFLVHVHQEIPDGLVKVIFLGEAETANRLDSKYWFGDVDLSKATPF